MYFDADLEAQGGQGSISDLRDRPKHTVSENYKTLPKKKEV